MRTGTKIALAAGILAVTAAGAVPTVMLIRAELEERAEETGRNAEVTSAVTAETTADTTARTTAETTAETTSDTTAETTAEGGMPDLGEDEDDTKNTADEIAQEDHIAYGNLREAVVANLRGYRADWYDLEADYFRDRAALLPDVVLSQDAMRIFPNWRSPFFEDNWFAVYEDIIYGDPLCFNALEDGMHLRFSSQESLEGGYFNYAYPISTMTREKYDPEAEKLEASWARFMDGMRELTAGHDTLESAMIVSESICARCFYDIRLEKRSMRMGLNKKKTTCMGYTNWFNSAMRELGYLVTTVRSEDLEHIWSAVYVPEQNRWAEIDVTWIDGMVLAAKNIALPDYRDICYFDFSSRDPDAYPEHYCEDQVSLAELTESPAPITYDTRGWGYQYINNQSPEGVYATKIVIKKNGGFRILWSDGSATNASL